MPLRTNYSDGEVFAASDVNTTNAAVNACEVVSNKGVANGYAGLDSAGKVPVTQLPSSIMEYKGVWDASSNSPTLADGTGNTGDVYRVTVGGSRNLGGGSITFDVGDYVIFNSAAVWEKSDTTDAVASVAGRVGAVVLTSADVGLGNVSNTSDATKDAAATALTNKTSVTSTGAVTGSTLVSTVAQGTAPLTVTSTTIVNNLNAQYLNGVGRSDGAVANNVASRDANANLTARGFIPGFTTTATAAGTTTLTITSNPVQEFTGTTTQTCVLPTTGVVAGQQYTVINNSSGVVTVQSSALAAVQALAPNTEAVFTALIATPTAAAGWDADYSGAVQGLSPAYGAQASTLAVRDSSANITARNFANSVDTTATAAGTTTLTIASSGVQVFTGATTQTVVLPTTGVNAGQKFTIINQSTGALTIQSSALAGIVTLPAAQAADLTALQTTPTAATHWRAILWAQTAGLAATTSNTLAAFQASTTNAIGVGTVELGHASDTTLSRSAAGVLAVEGVDVVTTTGTQSLTGKTLTTPKINSIYDTANNSLVAAFASVPSAVNYLTLSSAAGTAYPGIAAAGTAADAGIWLAPKGTGPIGIYSPTGQSAKFQAGGPDANHDLTLNSKGTGTVQANGVPVVTESGTQTLTNKTLTSPKVDSLLDTNGATALTITPIASAVNAVRIIPNITGQPARIQAVGETNAGLIVMGRGTSGVAITDANQAGIANFVKSTTPVNYLTVSSSDAGVAIPVGVAGSDTNIGLNLTTKGAGAVQANGVDVVTTTGTQTLSGKSLVAPALGTPASGTLTNCTGLPLAGLAPAAYATASTASTLVQRDASGNFSAGTITAALAGNATSATSATNATNSTYVTAGVLDNTSQNINLRVVRNANTTTLNDGMYLGYGNSNASDTRIYGGGNTLTPVVVSNGGALAVPGALTGSSTVSGTRLISTVADGTAPLTVTSTTNVPNLNASTVSGYPVAVAGTGINNLAARDGNSLVFAKGFVSGFTTTATAAGTTTLTVASTSIQEFTGTLAQTVVLPSTGVAAGQRFTVINNSTGSVTVQSSSLAAVLVLAGGTVADFTALTGAPTTAGGWEADYYGSAVASGKRLSVSNSLTIQGTDGTTVTFPSTNSTLARTDAAQTFTGVQTFVSPAITTPTGIVKGDVGLGSVDNTADAAKAVLSATKLTTARTINGVSFDGTANVTVADSTKEPSITAGVAGQYWTGTKTWATLNAAAVTGAEATANKNAANGYCGLDSSGLVAAAQLPSYVDDVLEYANLAGFPATGTTGKIFVALDTNKTYRWSGTVYIEISPSPGSTDSVTEGSTNLYYTNARADARITAATGSSVQAYNANLTTLAGKTAPTGVLVGTTDTQTLTAKTLTSPIISTISNTGTLTLPTSTDTLVGRATTDTLTNKTLTSPVISTISNTGTLTLPTSTDTLVGRATTDTLTNKTLTNPTINAYTEGVVAVGTVTTASTLALTAGTVLTATLTASTACTFTMPTATAGKSFTLLLKQAATTGGGSATFTGVKWNAAGAPTITSTAARMDILSFFSDGTNWYGSAAQGYTP